MTATEYNKRQNYSSALWRQIQVIVGTTSDGIPGPQTAKAVAVWQWSHGLTDDGKVGPATLDAMPLRTPVKLSGRIGTARVRCTPTAADHGYNRTTVRADVAERLNNLRDELEAAGAILTSAGGLRNLKATVTAGRASFSLHYLGLAHDLATYSGAQSLDPDENPYIVTRRERGSTGQYDWHVWARAEGGTERELMAVVDGRNETPTQAKVVSLTDLARENGLYAIGSRSCYPKTYGCAEWWHFEARDLCEGRTFGELLREVWSDSEIEASRFTSSQLAATWRGGYFK